MSKSISLGIDLQTQLLNSSAKTFDADFEQYRWWMTHSATINADVLGDFVRGQRILSLEGQQECISALIALAHIQSLVAKVELVWGHSIKKLAKEVDGLVATARKDYLQIAEICASAIPCEKAKPIPVAGLETINVSGEAANEQRPAA